MKKFKITQPQISLETYIVTAKAKSEEGINWDEVYSEAPYIDEHEIDDTIEPEVHLLRQVPLKGYNIYKVKVTQSHRKYYTVTVSASDRDSINWDEVYDKAPYHPNYEIDELLDPEIEDIAEPKIYSYRSAQGKDYLESETGDITAVDTKEIAVYYASGKQVDYYFDTAKNIYLNVVQIHTLLGTEYTKRIAVYNYLMAKHEVFSTSTDKIYIFTEEAVLDACARFNPELYQRIKASNLLTYIAGENSESAEVTKENFYALQQQVAELDQKLTKLIQSLAKLSTSKP